MQLKHCPGPPRFAQNPRPASVDSSQREDLRALAVVLLECILSALAFSGPSQLTSAESIQVGERERATRDRPPFEPSCISMSLRIRVLGHIAPLRSCRPCNLLCPARPCLQRLLGEVFSWGVDEFRCAVMGQDALRAT